MTTPGWRPGMSEADYLADPSASASALGDLERSAAYLKWRKSQPREETDDTILGTATHCAILEPERFAAVYRTLPDDAPKKPDKRQREAKKPSAATLEAIAWHDTFNANNVGKIVVSRDIYREAQRLREACEKNPEAVDLLAACPIREVPGFATMLGVPVKIKPDARGDGVMLDIKTCREADERTFQRAVLTGNYHASESLYRDVAEILGARTSRYRFLALDKSEGPVEDACVVYTLDTALVQHGRVKIAGLLARWQTCVKISTYPARVSGRIDCPSWLGRPEQYDGEVEDDDSEGRQW